MQYHDFSVLAVKYYKRKVQPHIYRKKQQETSQNKNLRLLDLLDLPWLQVLDPVTWNH